jgi:hypothetical protein
LDLDFSRRLLGELYRTIRDDYLVWSMGFNSHRHLANHLGMNLRSLQRYARLTDAFAVHPVMEETYLQGMDLTRLELIIPIIEKSTVSRWLGLARSVPVIELRRAVSWAFNVGAEKVLTAYEVAKSEATESVAYA